MQQAIDFFINGFRQIISKLEGCRFELGGYEINLMAVFVVFLVLSFVISVYWRGAKG